MEVKLVPTPCPKVRVAVARRSVMATSNTHNSSHPLLSILKGCVGGMHLIAVHLDGVAILVACKILLDTIGIENVVFVLSIEWNAGKASSKLFL